MPAIRETMGWRWATMRVIEIRSCGDGSRSHVGRRTGQSALGSPDAKSRKNRRRRGVHAAPVRSAATVRRAQGHLKTRSMSLGIFLGLSSGPAIFPLERRKRWW
jgi:hypothetical protein